MPDVVNDQKVGATAAEFVLGTLDSDERARANELLGSDDQFRDLVRIWERRFGELHLMVEPVEPPTPIWDRIRGKMGGVAATGAVPSTEAVAEAVPSTEPVPSEPPMELRAPGEPGLTLDALEAELRQAGIAGSGSMANRPAEAVTPAADTPAADALATDTPPLVIPASAAPAVLAEDTAAKPSLQQASRESRSLRRWRLAAVVTTLLAAALAGLIAAWRYIPERLPPQLQVTNVLNMRAPERPSPPAARRPQPPPESQFDE